MSDFLSWFLTAEVMHEEIEDLKYKHCRNSTGVLMDYLLVPNSQRFCARSKARVIAFLQLLEERAYGDIELDYVESIHERVHQWLRYGLQFNDNDLVKVAGDTLSKYRDRLHKAAEPKPMRDVNVSRYPFVLTR